MSWVLHFQGTMNSKFIVPWTCKTQFTSCCLLFSFFCFLCAGEFTVNSSFDPSIHLTVQDLKVNAEVNPPSLRIHIKVSKLTLSDRVALFIWAVVVPLFAQSVQSWLISISKGPHRVLSASTAVVSLFLVPSCHNSFSQH